MCNHPLVPEQRQSRCHLDSTAAQGQGAPHKAGVHQKPPKVTAFDAALILPARGHRGPARDTPSAHARLPASLLTPTAAHLLLSPFRVTRRHRYPRGGGKGQAAARRGAVCACADGGVCAVVAVKLPPPALPPGRRAGACAEFRSEAPVLSRRPRAVRCRGRCPGRSPRASSRPSLVGVPVRLLLRPGSQPARGWKGQRRLLRGTRRLHGTAGLWSPALGAGRGLLPGGPGRRKDGEASLYQLLLREALP